MRTETIKIAGMSCQHCENAVNNALKNLSGVSKVEVNLPDAYARVEFDERSISLKDLWAAIEEEGYKVQR